MVLFSLSNLIAQTSFNYHDKYLSKTKGNSTREQSFSFYRTKLPLLLRFGSKLALSITLLTFRHLIYILNNSCQRRTETNTCMMLVACLLPSLPALACYGLFLADFSRYFVLIRNTRTHSTCLISLCITNSISELKKAKSSWWTTNQY